MAEKTRATIALATLALLMAGFIILIWDRPESATRSGSLTAEEKAALNNASRLASAANLYYLENGVTVATYAQLIGPNYLKSIPIIAGEQYPSYYTQGVAVTVVGVAGARTITYAP